LVPDVPYAGNQGLKMELTLNNLSSSTVNFLKSIGAPVTIRPKILVNNQSKLVCCEAKQQENVEVDDTTMGGGLLVETGMFPAISPFPPFNPLAITIPKVGTQGIYVQAAGEFGITLVHHVDNCANQDCYTGNGYITITGLAGIQIGDPEILKGNINVSTGFTGTATAGCGSFKATIAFNGITANATVTFLDLVTSGFAYQVLNGTVSEVEVPFAP
jgi:hypothetical protein